MVSPRALIHKGSRNEGEGQKILMPAPQLPLRRPRSSPRSNRHRNSLRPRERRLHIPSTRRPLPTSQQPPFQIRPHRTTPRPHLRRHPRLLPALAFRNLQTCNPRLHGPRQRRVYLLTVRLRWRPGQRDRIRRKRHPDQYDIAAVFHVPQSVGVVEAVGKKLEQALGGCE